MEVETNLDPMDEETLAPRRLCCCFPFSSPWERIDPPAPGERRRWWGGSLAMKAREWSELAAGPRWKTFLRRFRRNPNRGRPATFQYDPLSYTLNFDEGQGGDSPEGGYGGRLDFSARFAAPSPAPGKPSAELGGRDVSPAPPLAGAASGR
ncbi:hypothetical protein Cni_G05107 [Canna indica]|uniref:NHL repeat-containing protein n=1 Tax=Canna indica TaxID=4628 RepID=A0AAQ3Q4L8_9LILI|nr:hypothetical protein Cni_G05107 [Canna indica]